LFLKFKWWIWHANGVGQSQDELKNMQQKDEKYKGYGM